MYFYQRCQRLTILTVNLTKKLTINNLIIFYFKKNQALQIGQDNRFSFISQQLSKRDTVSLVSVFTLQRTKTLTASGETDIVC